MSDLPDGVELQASAWGERKTDISHAHTFGDVEPVIDGWQPPVPKPVTKRVPKRKGGDEPR